MQRRELGIAKSLGGLTRNVKESRVLLVGAGGIGCELLKNLVCCGFGSGWKAPQAQQQAQQQAQHAQQQADKKVAGQAEKETEKKKKAEIVVIDLDTIDLSNLNRQFLFRKRHIKQPKAFVAKETASAFNPNVNIDAHHASIFDPKYHVDFFEGFDIVFNALDNLAARRHVNRMCLAANVPLIESGTTGFNGQVQAIQKGVTECYDCNEKPVQKSFPICTIRSTPSQPIHCIVWAKSYLLPELFGTSEEDASDVAVTEGDNAEEVAKLKEEAEALKKIRNLIGKDQFAAEVFNKVYGDDIERLRTMKEMWQSRKAPDPLRFENVCIDRNPEVAGAELANRDQSVWSLLDNLKVFCYSIQQLSKRVQAGENVIEFDKDDKDTLDFVASAANLRSHVFGIPVNSEWDIKQMAGNIIPAIATSNALTASLCVLESFKILRSIAQAAIAQNATAASSVKQSQLLGGSKMVFLQSKSTDRIITSQQLVGPKPDCAVCSPVYSKIHIKEGSSPTLQMLVDLLRSTLGHDEFSIFINDQMLYDIDMEDNVDKELKDIGVDGRGIGFVTVKDDRDEPKVDLLLSVKVKALEGEEELKLSAPNLVIPSRAPKPAADTNGGVANDASGTALVDLSSSTKRKREAEDQVETATKKAKAGDDGPVYVVEDDGAILLN